jgi:hypothetical protein
VRGAQGPPGGQVPPAPAHGGHGASDSCRSQVQRMGGEAGARWTGRASFTEWAESEARPGKEKTTFSFYFFNPN